ncbi:MAG: F0F1 ATP synthase subunit B [Gammaproteobacteria bacterium]|nr:F0F1 ATP synthase subunit B [Gammaproteobacteria bacterium]
MDINATLLGQLITFIILVWFTMKYVWPPITSAISEREKKIADGLEAGERAKRELELAEHKALDIVRVAKSDAAHIIDLAHKRSVQLVDEAKEDARVEGKRILEQAHEEFARDVSRTKEELRLRLAGLAIAGAEKVIKRNLDATTQANLLDDFVAEL